MEKFSIYGWWNDCSMTCVGMCIKKSPKTIYNDGFTSSICDWSGIGSNYGKTLKTVSATLSNLASTLSNYPAIVGVGGHFVVVYKFEGDPDNPQKSDFSVHDPARSDGTLDRSAYSDITSIRYYK
ncbi:MAG: hypothetical protein PHV07_08875 [Oscillospiraceae bacterium]|nr:hypothetical protein [Oscillospiraceae bacterium]